MTALSSAKVHLHRSPHPALPLRYRALCMRVAHLVHILGSRVTIGLTGIISCAGVLTAASTYVQRPGTPSEPHAIEARPILFDAPKKIRVSDTEEDTSPAGRFAAIQAADEARSDFVDYFGSRKLAPGEFIWRAEPSNRSAMHIVISIPDQRAYVYEGPILIAATTISTGRAAHPTPAGVFPIIEKYELKLSNLYESAPMHFMQRLTFDGIALHAGQVPGYPASHGCVRLPSKFAEKLFSLTMVGTPVLISS